MNRNSRLCSVYGLLIAECITPRCHESEAKYVCPECKIAYCSTKCFNNHNPKCTERFYSKLVLDEISLRQKEDKEKDAKKMAEILQRVGEEVVEPLMIDSVVNEEEEAQLEDLARQIEEGKDISVNALPPTYHDAFLRDVANGDITSIIPPWTPWWLMPESEHTQLASPLVTDLDAKSQSSTTIPCIKRFLSTKAFQDVRLPVHVSPCVSYNALEVAYLYCFFMRFYNGDEESREDIVASIAKHSSVLSKNAVFSSADKVIASLMSDSRLQQLVEQESKVGNLESEKEERFCMMVFFDVLTLLEIPHYLIDALADITLMIRAVWPKDIGKERKCAFFTTYFRKMDTETFWLLRKEVEASLEVFTKKTGKRAIQWVEEL